MQIPQDSRASIKYFEYKKQDRSFVFRLILDPIAQKMLPMFPQNFSSHIPTVFGASFILFSHIFCLATIISPISFIVQALSLMVYQICDTLNQKIAIRDHTNSAVTLLIDHILDHVCCCLIILNICTLIQLSSPMEWIIFPIVAIIPFSSKYLNLYYLDRMILQKINPPDEGIFLLQIICLASAFWPQFWTTRIAGYIQPNTVLFLLSVLVAVLFTVMNLKQAKDSKDQKFTYKNMASCLSTTYICVQFLILNSDVLKDYTLMRLLEWTFILVHSMIIGRILVYHMMGEKFKPVSLGYLLVSSCLIVTCIIMYFVELQQKGVICNLLSFIVFVLSFAYSVKWTSNTISVLNEIIGN